MQSTYARAPTANQFCCGEPHDYTHPRLGAHPRRSHRSRPFAWGAHDCASWVFDLRRDLTGGADVAVLSRRRYPTARGAALVRRRLGWASLEEGARALLGAPLGSVHLAQRGDLVLIAGGTALGISLGARAAFLAPEGLAFVPTIDCSLAWRI